MQADLLSEAMTQLVLDLQVAASKYLLDTEPDSIACEACRRTSAMAWHYALDLLSSMRPKSTTQARLRTKALSRWRAYGAIWGLREGVDVISLEGPSPLSDERPYWNIIKRCYYEACPCRATIPCHRMRVCKGCYRVLYCGSRCQRQ